MATITLKQDNFDHTVENNDIVLVDFWASWCGPCRSFAPVFEAASEKYPDLVFGKINTEEEQGLAMQYQIRSIPTLMLFRERIILFMQPGALSASQLEDLITRAKALDMDAIRQEIEQGEAEEATQGTSTQGAPS